MRKEGNNEQSFCYEGEWEKGQWLEGNIRSRNWGFIFVYETGDDCIEKY